MTRGTFASFGPVLKEFRTRRELTQQTLAEKLGVRRNTIGNWERGEFLPQSKGVVLELARHLHLDDEEIRQLLEASLILAPYWLVPLRRNPYFTGREEILEAIHTQLGFDQTVALTQSLALRGLGGVGKTQIALEYAYRHALEYSAVLWIGAETEENIVASLLHIAEMLHLPEREDTDQQRVVVAVQRWLSAHSQWLLIWDNVEDLALLDRFLPATRSGAILLTTSRQALGMLAHRLDLLPMEQEEGILLLLRRAGLLASGATDEHMQQFAERVPAQYAVAAELVTALGGLPLALDQAGAYVEETHCGLVAYLDLYQTRQAALLQLRGEGSRDHPASVSTTFTLAITTVARHHPAVRDLLQICALLLSEAIPEEIFRQAEEQLGPALAAVCGDPLEWDRVAGLACTYSLLVRQPEEQTLSLHRLVQAVLLDEMSEEEREQQRQRAIAALDKIFPEVYPTMPQAARKQGERLLPHVLWSLHQTKGDRSFPALASLTWKAARYLHACGRYRETESLYQEVLSIREQQFGRKDPRVAQVLNALAILLRAQGKCREAEPLAERELAICEEQLGPEHPDVARSLNALAGLYWRQGKYAQSISLLQRAISLYEQHLGSEHPNVARSRNNLALLYQEQGRYAEAEQIFQHAVDILEQHHGSDEPELASLLRNMANLYRLQGNYDKAERFFVRTLQIMARVSTSDHPQMAESLYGLALLAQARNNDREAESLYQQAWQIWQEALGPENPEAAQALSGLASLAWKEGKDAKAEVLYQRVLAIREQHLGEDHPGTAETLHDLTLLRQKQGNLDEC